MASVHYLIPIVIFLSIIVAIPADTPENTEEYKDKLRSLEGFVDQGFEDRKGNPTVSVEGYRMATLRVECANRTRCLDIGFRVCVSTKRTFVLQKSDLLIHT